MNKKFINITREQFIKELKNYLKDKNIIMFIWIQGIGKSTLAKELQKKYNDIFILNADTIRQQYNTTNNKFVFWKLFDTFLEIQKKNRFTIILDNTNINFNYRKWWYKKIKSKVNTFSFVLFPLNLQKALFQNEKRNIQVPNEVIIGYYNKYQPLLDKEIQLLKDKTDNLLIFNLNY